MSLAQINFDTLQPIASPFFGGTSKLGDIISSLLNYIIPLAGLASLVFLVIAGFQFLTSAGDPKKVEAAKGKLTYAIVGFIIVFISYWLVQIIARILNIEAIINIFG